jgi:hypothetical protein
MAATEFRRDFLQVVPESVPNAIGGVSPCEAAVGVRPSLLRRLNGGSNGENGYRTCFGADSKRRKQF